MSDGVFNISKGAVAEMVRDGTTKLLVLLLKANETEATLVDYDDVAALLVPAGNTEADATNYARKTDITGTVTVDDSNDRVDVDMPDQTWTALGNGTNNTLTKLITAYENAAADATRIPCTHHDFPTLTDGSDVTAQFNSAGFFRAA